MKHKHQYHHDKNLHPVNAAPAMASRPVTDVVEKQDGLDFKPTVDEVAHRAYEIYEHDGSLPGFDVQHWLAAEAQLTAERVLTLDGGMPV
jgi:hypothetical protein